MTSKLDQSRQEWKTMGRGRLSPRETDDPQTFRTLLEEAVQAFPQFDVPPTETPNVSGADLVEWFDAWRQRVKAALDLFAELHLNARYLAHRGTRCPFCDSDEVEGAEVTTGNGTAMQEMSCLSCQHAWVDRYTLTAITVEPEATVTCSLCHCPTPALSAHLHQGQWIGDECWDERLQASE